MKIVQIVSARGLNGAIRHCAELTRELALRGHKVVLAHKPGAWIAKQTYPPGVEFFETSLKRRPGELRRVGRAFRERGVEVIHSHNSSAHFFGVIIAGLYGFPKVATCHMPFFQPYWRWNDRVIAPSPSTARLQRWLNWVPRRRIDVIPYFLQAGNPHTVRSRSEVRASLGVAPDAFLIICAGEIGERKNQLLLLRALVALRENGCDAVLLLAGRTLSKYLRKVEAFVDEEGLGDRVQLLGSRNDLTDLLAASDCFCLPSNREVMPLACLEAMAAGVAVVITETGGIGELLENGEDAMIVPRGDLVALTRALADVAGDLKLRQNLIQSAREKIARDFHPDICVERILDTYRRARRQKLGDS